MKRRIQLVLSFILISLSAFAQQSGTIRGTVKDAKTQEDIIGASVYVEELGKGTATDVNGFFTIKVPVGTYKVRVSFVGYTTKFVEKVGVFDANVTDLKVFIAEESTALTEVKVVAQRQTNTEVSVISEIKASQQIVSGISAAQIGKTLDRDAAQVVRRIPGVTIFGDKFINIRGLNQRYNPVMLHNAFAPSMETDSRSFSFDIIPSSQLDRLLVFKSPAAELPGEFAGGVVKIYTKSIPDQNSLTIDYSTSFRDNTTGKDFFESPQGSNYALGFNNGYADIPKYFPANRDELLAATPERLQQIGQTFRNNWKAVQSTASPDQRVTLTGNFKLNLGNIKVGNITAVTYSDTRNTTVSTQREFAPLNTAIAERLVNDFEDDRYSRNIRVGVLHNWAVRLNENHLIEFKNLFNQLSNAQYVYRTGFDGNNNYNARNHSFDQVYRGIYTGQLVGTHKFNGDKTKIDWVIGVNKSYRDQPDYRRYRSDYDKASNTTTLYVPTGAAQAFFLGRTYLKLDENTYTAGANFTQKILLKGSAKTEDARELELKAGLFFETKDRTFNNRNLGYVTARRETFNVNLNQPIEQIFLNQNINSTTGLKIDEQTNASDSYTSSNNQLAGYVQGNMPLSKRFNIIAGLRFEKNTMKLNSALLDRTPVNYNRDITVALPSVNATYNLSEKNLIRLAYGQSINRPEFREIAPFAFFDFVTNRVIKGNPTLVDCNIHNIDLRYEYYPTPSEIVSIAGFYKLFNNPIEVVFEGGANTTPNINFQNGDKAVSAGIEIEVRKNLAGNTGSRFLDKLNVVFNAAWIYSKVTLKEDIAATQSNNRPLQGQSPYILNFGLNYNDTKKDLQLNVLYNVIGKRIYAVGFNNGGGALYPDWYEVPRNVVDITFAKGIGERFILKGGINDLLNEPNVILQDGNQDGKLDTGTDQIIQSYKTGRLYSLGISYKIFGK